MDKLAGLDGLIVQQKKEWGEILTGFETVNRYAVMDPSGNELYAAAEVGGSFLLRNFLKSLRPFTIHLVGLDGARVLRIERPFRWYFQRVEVFSADGDRLGSVERRFSLARRIFTVADAQDNELYELFGPILHPWTFQIRRRGMELGKITKRWSGLLKEGFTDADNFGIAFPADAGIVERSLLLGAVFLVDFCYFEKTGNNN